MQLLKPIYLLFLAPLMVVGCVGRRVTAEPTRGSAPTMPPLEISPAAASPGAAQTNDNQSPDWCVGPDIHPIGQRIADNFDVSYEQVIKWHCKESDFEDILLALETNELSGAPVELILEMRANQMSWEQIWKDLEITD